MTPPLSPEQMKELEERIKELVPELMELSFGCRLKYNSRHDPSSYGSIARIYKRCDGVEMFYISYDGDDEDNQASRTKPSLLANYTILGHPITLEHIVLAMERSQTKKFKGKLIESFGVSRTGGFWISYKNCLKHRKYTVMTYWKWLQPWENQHEVHGFLYEYLVQ